MTKELEVLNGLLDLRAALDTDFSAWNAKNVFSAVDEYLRKDNAWSSEQKAEFKKLLAELEIDEADLASVWRQLRERIEGEVPEALRPLILKFNDFELDEPGVIEWPFEFTKGDVEFAKAVGGKFNVEFVSNLKMTAYPQAPDNVAPVVEGKRAACHRSQCQYRIRCQDRHRIREYIIRLVGRW
mgnify:CR=1 FL=1